MRRCQIPGCTDPEYLGGTCVACRLGIDINESIKGKSMKPRIKISVIRENGHVSDITTKTVTPEQIDAANTLIKFLTHGTNPWAACKMCGGRRDRHNRTRHVFVEE